MEGRVRSRLAGGLIVDIQPPDIETRIAILRSRADHSGQTVSPDMIMFLAERIRKNVRELEGCLNRILAYAELTRRPITIDLVKRAVADSLAANFSGCTSLSIRGSVMSPLKTFAMLP